LVPQKSVQFWSNNMSDTGGGEGWRAGGAQPRISTRTWREFAQDTPVMLFSSCFASTPRHCPDFFLRDGRVFIVGFAPLIFWS
jgi:hypothetical protein